jgi:hypothetical protein
MQTGNYRFSDLKCTANTEDTAVGELEQCRVIELGTGEDPM